MSSRQAILRVVDGSQFFKFIYCSGISERQPALPPSPLQSPARRPLPDKYAGCQMQNLCMVARLYVRLSSWFGQVGEQRSEANWRYAQ